MKKREKIIQKKNLKNYRIFLILTRYLILLIIMFSLNIIYFIFTPLTIYPVYLFLKVIYTNVELVKIAVESIPNYYIIIDNSIGIEIIPTCIAGSAYLLILILNLSVPMNILKRIKSIILSFIILLSLNIIRIIIFSILYYSNTPYFDFAHKFFWYIISTFFVIGIWFLIVKIYRIKEIPVYSDFKTFIKEINSIKK
ncbi:MAG: pacearchaeosortase [Candidatus Pacearchaeota archaeon]